MKRKIHLLRFLIMSLAVFILLSSCNKNRDKNNHGFSDESKPFKTTKAEAIGALMTRWIGPEGGSFSFNGDVVIEVPAGAVDKPTQFSIQPVKSQIQPANGKTNYELLPHNVTFNKPVKITFRYNTDSYSLSEDALRVAYRKDDGTWHSLPTELNKENQTLTVTKQSFSEFEFFEKYILYAETSNLGSGEKTDLLVGVIYEDFDGLIVPLVPHFKDGNKCYFLLDKKSSGNITGWSIIEQIGSIAVKNNSKSIATYTAPSTLTQPKATVQVRIEGIKSPISTNGGGNGSVLILRKEISLTNGWIKLTIDGETRLLTHNLNATQFEQYSFGVAGMNEDGTVDFSVAVIIKDGQAGTGTYPLGLLEKGTSIVSLFNRGEAWESTYYDCSSNTGQSSQGNVNITQWSNQKGEMTKGNFSVTLHRMTGTCDKESKTAHVEFEVPRAEY